MRTVNAAARAVSILFSGETPPARGTITALVKGALEEAGLPPWETVEAECFRAGEDTLLLARPGRERRYFFFAGLEALLIGARHCAGGAGALYRDGAGFLLAADPAAAGPGLYEFGELCSRSEDWECHAREQGQMLLEGDAAGTLCRWFST